MSTGTVPSTKTKIVATVGPASQDPDTLRAMILAGADVFRLNFSHGTPDAHTRALGHIRAISDDLDQPVGVLQDLCGPKIRVGPLAQPEIDLQPGQRVALVRGSEPSGPDQVTATYDALVDDLVPGARVLLCDGQVVLRVVGKEPDRALATVEVGGVICQGKGINLPGLALSAPSLTAKDRADVAWGARHGVDYVALSFVREADDVRQLKQLLHEHGSDARIIAKIEKPEALDHIDAILDASDGLMVARGDLGVEMAVWSVPMIQKDLIARANAAGVPVITATQMLESMIGAPTPTRAEVSDVANAILDGTDAVMLSGETAVGRYPVHAVRAMHLVAEQTEAHLPDAPARSGAPGRHRATTIALAGGVSRVASNLRARLVFVATHHGTTALCLSKCRNATPTVGISDRVDTVRRMCLYWGVTPRLLSSGNNPDQMLADAVAWARARGLVQPGDHVVFAASTHWTDTSNDLIIVHEVDGQPADPAR